MVRSIALIMVLLVPGIVAKNNTLLAEGATNNTVQLLIKFQPQVSDVRARELLREFGAQQFRPLAIPRNTAKPPMDRWWSAGFESETDLLSLMRVIRDNPEVETVELDSKVMLLPESR